MLIKISKNKIDRFVGLSIILAFDLYRPPPSLFGWMAFLHGDDLFGTKSINAFSVGLANKVERNTEKTPK
jgi:hypothetical protein